MSTGQHQLNRSFITLNVFEFQLQVCWKFSILVVCTSAVEVSKVSVHLIDRFQGVLPKNAHEIYVF